MSGNPSDGGNAGVSGNPSEGGNAGVSGSPSEGGNAGVSGSPSEGGNAGVSGNPSDGGNGGASGSNATPGHLDLSNHSLNFNAVCDVAAQSVIISNDGGSPVTWVANLRGAWSSGSNGGAMPVQMTPNTATLAPGESVTVEVSPISPAPTGTFSGAFFLVVDNVTSPPIPMLEVRYAKSGFNVPQPPDVDLGEVPLSSGLQTTISVYPYLEVPALILHQESSTDPASSQFFVPYGLPMTPPHAGYWTVQFMARTVGPASITLTVASMTQVVCPPNSFIVRAVVVAP